MSYISSILLNSAQLYPTLFQLCLTVRPFGSALLNYALHFFNSADVAQSHTIFPQFCSNLLNYVLNYLNHSLHLLNSTQCSSIMPYIYSDRQMLLNDTLYFLNSAQGCSFVSRITSIIAYISSFLLNVPQLYPTFIQFCKFGSTMPYIPSIPLNSAQLYPTLSHLSLTVPDFGSTLFNCALHLFNSTNSAQSCPIFPHFYSIMS